MKVKFINTHEVNFTQLNAAASKDDLRPVMQGAYIDLKNRCIVATDAHILVSYPIKITENDSEQDGFIVPTRLFNYLKYMVDLKKKDFSFVEFELTEDYAEAFYLGEMVYRAKYIDGKYPLWKNVMPTKNDIQSINEIGLGFGVLKKLISALPTTVSGYKFSFTAKNKAILVEPLDADYAGVKGIMMPTMING
jgi:DNA polymerase III beta subunit-like protein